MNIVTSNCHRCLLFRCNNLPIHPSRKLSIAPGSGTSRFPFYPYFSRGISGMPFVAFAKKNNSNSERLLNPSIVDEVSVDGEEDDVLLDDLEDDELLEDDGYFGDEYFEEEPEPSAGDGAGGGGISLAGTLWDKKALEITEEVALSFNGELGIYAFRTLRNATIQVRIERLTNKSGSPDMTDIEAFSTAYRAKLAEAEANGDIPSNMSLEVSSPGVERVVRVPEDLERFKERNLYVKYAIQSPETGSATEHDGVLRLVCYDAEGRSCTWGLADVRVNREKAGKGRPLNKKQKEWRLNTPLDSLRLVRFFTDI